MSKKVLIGVYMQVILAATFPALAQEPESCLPALMPDIVDLSHNLEINLAVLDKMSSTTNEADKTKIGAKYGNFAFDFGSSQDVSNTLKKLLKIEYSRREMDTLHLSTLSDNAVEAYVECIHIRQKEEIAYSFPGDIVDDETFFLSINWQPLERPEIASAKVVVKVSQGQVVEANGPTFEGDIFDRKMALVTVKRDPDKSVQVAIIVNNEVKSFEIPPRTAFELGKGVIDSTMPGGKSYKMATRENRGDVGSDVCVRLPDEAQNTALVPGTFRIIYAAKRGVGVTLGEGELKPGDRQICKFISVAFQTPFKSYAEVDATAVMDTFIAVPRK
ncbi:hypothetical protein HLH89_28715 [Rhizobium laguerreae]|uniref:hypothetical protein n=1 Tax=Rhizobium laguerreae TaxID=1076926 RepID=UPI0014788F21|nr:hypothetical protein [Rhizobium laguerreae]NNH84981.1 hypothetical protein [Rhizobium laguerreae]